MKFGFIKEKPTWQEGPENKYVLWKIIFLDQCYKIPERNDVDSLKHPHYPFELECTHHDIWDAVNEAKSLKGELLEHYISFIYIRRYDGKRLGKRFINKIKYGEIPLLCGNMNEMLTRVEMVEASDIKNCMYEFDTKENDIFTDYLHFGIIHQMDGRLETKEFYEWFSLFYILKTYGYVTSRFEIETP